MTPERPTPEEAEIQVALAAGVLAADEAARLMDEARRQAQGPLEVLLQQGRLTDETFASLSRDAREVTAPERPEVEDVPTLPPSGWTGPDAPPVPGWDRYRFVRLLGEGGMGRVYLAYDPRLQRNVALKFVKDGDRELAQRFAFEARAQARVDHPSVGKVFEVGEVEGRPFIAMQYVDGQPLHLAAPSLGLERKVMLLRDAALGVNEAHRAGIIHRDLKPSNLMVEAPPTGEPRLFVMDFGLARDWSATTTAAGSVLGTPQYMAPEQASGDVATLDRRVDVYALGATLYHVLCGEPPIPGSNALEVLRNVFTVEPRPIRQIAPDVPGDLQAVVMKCLEKNRSDRYDSARALADDLDRFLAGEPVHARAYGPLERARKYVRKHRRAAAVSAATLAVVLAAIGWGARARLEASRREQFARAFTEKVEQIEAGVRYSQLSPLHDTTADRRALSKRMEALEADVASGGESARGPGEYALGRGALALGDARRALEHLQAAWDSGFREPRVAYALALVNGQLYREGLEEAERSSGKDVREARRRDVEKRFRDPALGFLRQSQGAEVPSAGYVSALVAFYEGRLDDALKDADAIGDSLPWFFEAPLLKAQLLAARASRQADSGDSQHAAQDFDTARAAAAAAARIGESVPAVHLALAQVEWSAMRAAVLGKGDVEGPYERGLAAVAVALRADPASAEARLLEASFHRKLGEQRLSQGKDGEAFERARRAAEAARSTTPDRPEAATELTRILSAWAQQRVDQGRDPRELVDRALELAAEENARGPDLQVAWSLGSIHHNRATYEKQVGADPLVSFDRAIDAYQRVVQLDESSAIGWANLGDEYRSRASLPGANDPDGDLKRAAEALDRAMRLNPESWATCYHAADLRQQMATRARARGEDPGPLLDKALELYRAGSALNPKVPNFFLGAGDVMVDQARDFWERGGNPLPLVGHALQEFERAVTLAPEQGFGQNNAGRALTVQARFQSALGLDPAASLDGAEHALRDALDRFHERQAIPWANLGAVQVLRARRALTRGQDPSGHILATEASVAAAFKLNPSLSIGWLDLGEVHEVRAGWEAARGRSFEASFEQAVEEIQKAIAADPNWPLPRLALARCLWSWSLARRQSAANAAPVLARAIEAAEAALRSRPGWTEAAALRAAATIALAAGPQRLDEARRQLDDALRRNPNLTVEWGSFPGR